MPIRPIAVLDACALVPPGLRDLLLSCADMDVFRPVWQSELEDELRRNGARLVKKKGRTAEEADKAMEHLLAEMNSAFPDARLSDGTWEALVSNMTNHPKDRHVLAAAVAADATHVVTSNLRDFPVRSRPPGIEVVGPDAFLIQQLKRDPARVLEAVKAMARRHRRPPQSPRAIAVVLAGGRNTPRFGEHLLRVLGEK
jgi:predicted nucleic acid-binding protein